MSKLADKLDESLDSDTLIIDSIPIPTCRAVREKRSKACRNPELDIVMASKVYNAGLHRWYIGYKLHLITNEYGVYRDLLITTASAHDNIFIKDLCEDDEHLSNKTMLGDKAYIGLQLRLDLFNDLNTYLDVPYRKNQHDFKEYAYDKKIKRKTIETVFSQYCDEFMLKRNYAKRFLGLEIRILTKVAAKTFKQFWNSQHNVPINRTKHSLAA